MFLRSWYLQRMLNNYGWFLYYKVANVLTGFSVIYFLSSFSFFLEKKNIKKRKTEATPKENLSQKTPSGQSLLYKQRNSQNYPTFLADTKKLETRVRTNKINS